MRAALLKEKTVVDQVNNEELINSYYTWLQKHFKKNEEKFLEALFDSVDDNVLLHIAHEWYLEYYKNEFQYKAKGK